MLVYVFSFSSMMGIAGILLLTMILLKRSYRHIRRSKRKMKKSRKASRQRLTAMVQRMTPKSLDAPAEVAKWEVHLHEVSRELFAQLDNKMIALSHLIEQAEQQCKRLEAATLEAERTDTIDHAGISNVN